MRKTSLARESLSERNLGRLLVGSRDAGRENHKDAILLPATLPVPTFLVAPSAIFRSGLEQCLEDSRFDIVASYSSFGQIQLSGAADGHEALLLIDGTVGHAAALQDLENFKRAHPGGRGVVLVQNYEPDNLLAAYRLGVDGYLSTSVSGETLLAYLSLIMSGEMMIPLSAFEMVLETSELRRSAASQVATEKAPAEPWDGVNRRSQHGLTFREASILRCLMDGDSNKVIARKCDISEATVKVHVKVILRKINAKNRTQAALWATAHLDRVERRMRRI